MTVDHSTICGIDEAGRGAFAGPLVAASVIPSHSLDFLSRHAKSPIRDSKTLSFAQRERVYAAMEEFKVTIQVSIIDVTEINEYGIGKANTKSIEQLIASSTLDSIVVDGNMKLASQGKQVKSIIDADATIPAVILAGIAAKVTRDRIMLSLHQEFPKYGWNENKGYGTLHHRMAIKNFGLTQHHRIAFCSGTLLY